VATLRDEGGFQEAISKERSISERLSIYHPRKAIFSYATLKSGGLSPFAAVEVLGVLLREQRVYCPCLQMIGMI